MYICANLIIDLGSAIKDEREETIHSNDAILYQHHYVGSRRYSPSPPPQRDDLHEAGPTGRAAMPQPPSSPRKRFMLQQRMHAPLPLPHPLRAHGQRTELRIRRHPVYGYDHRTFITTAGKTSQKLLHLS